MGLGLLPWERLPAYLLGPLVFALCIGLLYGEAPQRSDMRSQQANDDQHSWRREAEPALRPGGRPPAFPQFLSNPQYEGHLFTTSLQSRPIY
jgi:hypothetical protein